MKKAIVLLVLAQLACTVKYTYTKPGYPQGDKALKRIRLMVEPKAVDVPGVPAALLQIKREYLAVEKNYIVLPDPDQETNFAGLEAICKSKPEPQAVLKTEMRKLEREKDEVRVGLRLVLLDCQNERLWDAYAENTYESMDSDRQAMIRTYGARFGKPVEPYAVPIYEILRRLLEKLPNPNLSAPEQREKMRYFPDPSSKNAKS